MRCVDTYMYHLGTKPPLNSNFEGAFQDFGFNLEDSRFPADVLLNRRYLCSTGHGNIAYMHMIWLIKQSLNQSQ